jgi:hypothetical protein
MRDIDKLIAAFADLSDEGIIAFHNHLCCKSCATDDIGVLYERLSPEEKALWTGAVYYHGQDAEDVVESGSMYLGYGSLSDPSDKAVGERVAEVLRARGLSVKWDGSPFGRILVTGLRVSKYDIPPGKRSEGGC